MAVAHMSDEFSDAVAPHLPSEKAVGLKGGGPWVDHLAPLQLIWFVLAAGTRGEDVPEELPDDAYADRV